MDRFSLLLCVAHRIYREGLQKALADRPEISAVLACDGPGHIDGLALEGVDSVLVDVRADQSGDSAASVRTTFAAARGKPVVALGLDWDENALLASVEAGAAACVTVDQSIDDLVAIVQAALRGDLVCPPRISRLLQEHLLQISYREREVHRLNKLSSREYQILSLLKDSLSNKLIARQLGLEVPTIKNHVHNIIVKLNVQSRTEAAAMLRSAGEAMAGKSPKPQGHAPRQGLIWR
ncbi:LuxR C-terminal-related transcriptional regulator [Paracoccus benzoatiresistens]|uniref:Response regulator transcription factor n=1 Tax=Paracoccus benzoatiresistens TaxID=2997341 RepID=A0ABT4J5W0_9RHOB|nr:response regulator transcription factor [Paracoccus sp. EF6]MCZ0962500.1 response regulator transcription factor [Paracoccus sp. EF6]